MSTKNDIQKKAMLEALSKTLGNVTAAAEIVGISRNTHYSWVNEDSIYKLECENLSEQSLDYVESKLFELISGASREVVTPEGVRTIKDAPNATAIIFYLKTRGKNRGYIEKIDLFDKIVPPVQIVIPERVYNKI